MVGPLKFYDNTLTELQRDMKTFVRSNLTYFNKKWYKYTKDKYILDIITNGLKLDLKELPTKKNEPTYPLQSKENEMTSIEITKLLKKTVQLQWAPSTEMSKSRISV